MKKVITFLLFFCAFSGFSQSEISYHKISLEDKNDTPIGLNFSISKVYDGRQFKENIGTVQKGAFNKKVLANFEKPFEEEILNYLSVILPASNKNIAIRINDLYVSEITKAFSETGFATIVLDIIEQQEGNDFIVGTYSYTAEGNGMDVTNKHDDRLKESLVQIMTQYKNTSQDKKSQIAFDPNQIIANRTLVKKPKKGIYLTYADVLNEKPFTEDFNFNNKKEQYFIVDASGKDKSNYFGFSDGSDFYINISKYATGKYYAKTTIVGNKYFIENVVYNPNSVTAAGAMFGIIGVLVASSAGNGSVPMLIDCYSGQPIFLSNAEIKTLLKPQPALYKEYKDSKKTNEDIKKVLEKYYQLTSKQ
jgi:hypothetical protein